MAKASLTKEQVDFAVQQYADGKSTVEIAKYFGNSLDPDTVASWLKKRGVSIRPHWKRLGHQVNERYFQSIDSQDKAYWMGFLTADGCLVAANGSVRSLRFFLQEKDIKMIESFKKDIGYEGQIVKVSGRPQYGVAITRKEMAEDLIRHGYLDWKRGNPRIIDSIQPEMLHHFVRGFFDGDGCISDKSIVFSGHADHEACMAAVSRMVSISGVSEAIVNKRSHGKGGIGYSLTVAWTGRHNVEKIGAWLYRDANRFMPRKRDRFAEFMDPVEFSFADLSLKVVGRDEYGKFYKNYHYLGNDTSDGFTLGAFLGDEIVACATIGGITRSEIATKQGMSSSEVRELRRFCIHPNYHKKNFATWFMARAVSEFKKSSPHVRLLVSFADPSMGHHGTIYKASNWSFDGLTGKSYYYKDKDGKHIHKRTVYGRAVRNGLTERQYMEREGLKRIPTCPKQRFIVKI